MSWMNDPFDPDLPQSQCTCGKHASQAEHEEEMAAMEYYRLQLRLVGVEHNPEPRGAKRLPFPHDAKRLDWPGKRTHTIH